MVYVASPLTMMSSRMSSIGRRDFQLSQHSDRISFFNDRANIIPKMERNKNHASQCQAGKTTQEKPLRKNHSGVQARKSTDSTINGKLPPADTNEIMTGQLNNNKTPGQAFNLPAGTKTII